MLQKENLPSIQNGLFVRYDCIQIKKKKISIRKGFISIRLSALTTDMHIQISEEKKLKRRTILLDA